MNFRSKNRALDSSLDECSLVMNVRPGSRVSRSDIAALISSQVALKSLIGRTVLGQCGFQES